MSKLTIWSICKKTLALGLEILHHVMQAGKPTMKPGAMRLYGQYEDGDIDIVKLNYELEKLKIK